ncbi:response regulator [Methylorubrum thiocyanatum]|uniref:response regulator n=1 Tax=Methylorubrum thiocyanatum TaxID=47958 RepID=UPI00398C3F12
MPHTSLPVRSLSRDGPGTTERPLVIVAEDEIGVRTTTCEALSREGFRVIAAPTCDDALICLRTTPDVQALITDVITPGRVDGYELARIARDDFPHIAILITSAQSQPRHGDIALGAWFLAKPVDLNVLGLVLRECLEATGRDL